MSGSSIAVHHVFEQPSFAPLAFNVEMIIDIKIAVPTLLTIIIGSAINDMRSTAYALSWENVKMLNI